MMDSQFYTCSITFHWVYTRDLALSSSIQPNETLNTAAVSAMSRNNDYGTAGNVVETAFSPSPQSVWPKPEALVVESVEAAPMS